MPPALPKDEVRSRSATESASAGAGPLSPEATQKIVHDLRVHQIELELQNEELRRAQLQLEASRERFVELYDLAPIGYFTLAQTGLIEEANLTAASLFGVERSALIQKPLTRFILPADQDIYYQHRQKLIQSGTRQVCELRLLRKGDDPCWVRVEAILVGDGSGRSRVVVCDISVRKHAEETLRASEARHRSLFEKSRDALMTLAPPDWCFTAGNTATLALFGVPDEVSFLALPPCEYWPERQPDGSLSTAKAATMIEMALRKGSHDYEWTFKRLSGAMFPATVHLTKIEIEGQPLVQAAVRDQTETRILQAKLGQSDRLANMGLLAAGVAHEINNPLAYVLYNAESLANDLPKLGVSVERCLETLRVKLGVEAVAELLGEDARMLEPQALADLAKRASEALDGTYRIRNISKAIGTFSRVEETTRSRVDLNDAIECAATLALNDIKFKARLVLDLGHLPAVWASEGKLSQVFLNLMINAGQAIEEGDAQDNCIHVRSWVEGDQTFTEVADTGKGISETNLGRIFEPFFTTKAVGVGSGLGLSICRSIVTEFGGEIRAESQTGKGTRFIVRLPVMQGLSSVPHKPSEAAPDSVTHGRILVVDDEQSIRTAMVRLLGAEHQVVTASSGREALAILEQDQGFDVILCDLMMPEMTGMELHERLAVGQPVLAERVVFTTGGAFTLSASEYMNRVGNLRLEKPCDVTTLREVMAARVSSVRNKLEELKG